MLFEKKLKAVNKAIKNNRGDGIDYSYRSQVIIQFFSLFGLNFFFYSLFNFSIFLKYQISVTKFLYMLLIKAFKWL